MARKQQRAARFGVENGAGEYASAVVPEDEVKKQQRAERFGVEYKAAEGLMDIGDFLSSQAPVTCLEYKYAGYRCTSDALCPCKMPK